MIYRLILTQEPDGRWHCGAIECHVIGLPSGTREGAVREFLALRQRPAERVPTAAAVAEWASHPGAGGFVSYYPVRSHWLWSHNGDYVVLE